MYRNGTYQNSDFGHPGSDLRPTANPTNSRMATGFTEIETEITLLAAVRSKSYDSGQMVADRAPARPVNGSASAARALRNGGAWRIAFTLDLPV
jgi:hypothetical protein